VLPLAEKKSRDHFQPFKMLKFQCRVNLRWNFTYRTGSRILQWTGLYDV